MTEEMIWNLVLSAAIGAVSWVLKGYADELQRISILLNKTREETARDYVTKTDVQASVNMLIARIDSLDAKIDRILQGLLK
jgi:chlorite dismutase